ncbi:hypothetical protein [Bacillus cereus]|nr:hypothetical protein [Bacillus cereus]
MNKLHLKEIKLEELNSTMDIIYAVTGAAIVGGGVLIITLLFHLNINIL